MDTQERIGIYERRGLRLTPRQRRRMIKKAGRDPYAVVVREDGMGYSPAMQGYRELIGIDRPVSGVPAP
jgi:hypothetical protein